MQHSRDRSDEIVIAVMIFLFGGYLGFCVGLALPALTEDSEVECVKQKDELRRDCADATNTLWELRYCYEGPPVDACTCE